MKLSDDDAPDFQPNELLIAAPVLRDSNFSRSVIYLTEHNSEGAQGFVLNMPLANRVGDLISKEEFRDLAEVPVFRGGPVSTDKLTFAKITWDKDTDGLIFEGHLSTADAVAAHREGHDIRAYVGYAGWTEGQLEAELAEQAWFVHSPHELSAELEVLPDLWSTLMRHKGPIFELMSRMPIRPELN